MVNHFFGLPISTTYPYNFLTSKINWKLQTITVLFPLICYHCLQTTVLFFPIAFYPFSDEWCAFYLIFPSHHANLLLCWHYCRSFGASFSILFFFDCLYQVGPFSIQLVQRTLNSKLSWTQVTFFILFPWVFNAFPARLT